MEAPSSSLITCKYEWEIDYQDTLYGGRMESDSEEGHYTLIIRPEFDLLIQKIIKMANDPIYVGGNLEILGPIGYYQFLDTDSIFIRDWKVLQHKRRRQRAARA